MNKREEEKSVVGKKLKGSKREKRLKMTEQSFKDEDCWNLFTWNKIMHCGGCSSH